MTHDIPSQQVEVERLRDVLAGAFRIVDGLAGEMNGVPNPPSGDDADIIAGDLAELLAVPFDGNWPAAAAAALTPKPEGETVTDDGLVAEADAEVERILSLSDDQVLAEASPEDLAWAKLFKARMIAIKHALPGRYDGVSSHATIRGDADDAPYMLAIREALSSSPKPTTVEASGMVEGIRAVTAEMRRLMPNACGDWADKIDAFLRGELPSQNGTFACPICGQDTPHHHTPAVVDAYHNKRSRT